MQDGGGATLAAIDRERERSQHVLYALTVTEGGPGCPPSSERARRLG